MGPIIEIKPPVAWRRRAPAGGSRQLLQRLSDEDLMRLVVQRRDHQAFGVLYDRHSSVSFAAALRICRERALAEDAVQEAFLSVWRARRSYDSGRGNVRGWLLTIVRNRAIDVLRRALHDSIELAEPSVQDRLEALQRTDEEVDLRERASALRCALADLPVEQSSVIELAYYGGYTQMEIAAMFGAPVGTIKGRMRLGLQKLRAEMMSEHTVAWEPGEAA
jgi:RNA polymerase sigma-70 factor, ECF subfamily